MKKTGIILSLTILIVLSAASFCFAEPLKLEDTYPRDGYENAAIDNFGIKLYFNQDVINAENEEANKDCFVITDDEGKEVPTMVIYSDKEEGMLMVLADMTDEDLQIKQNSEYTLTIAGDFTAASGETLGEEQTIKVKTLDQAKASRINVIMMVIMMVGMIFFGRQTDKKQEEKKTVFFVTHDVDEAMLLANRIIVLGQSPSNVIFDMKIPDEKRTTRENRFEDADSIKLRNELLRYINRDVEAHVRKVQ